MRRRHRRVHLRIWRILIVALPVVLLVAMAARRVGPLEASSVRIMEPQ